MVKIYYNLIKLGTWTIDQVPALWKADVEAMLAEDDTM